MKHQSRKRLKKIKMMMRLNKFIADSGITSRRKAEELILQGRVTVNTATITDLAFKVNPETDEIALDGEKITARRHLYFLLNKPTGVVTTVSDEKSRRTVVDLIKTNERIYPVGRLDYNTTGVLILTNDGDFSQLLTHPGNKIPREYEAKLDRPLLPEDREKLLKGIYLIGTKGKFSKIAATGKNNYSQLRVTAVEGRNHFVKNMFGALGYTVLTLNRISFAGIKADIDQGKYRKLTNEEIKVITDKYGR